MDKCREAFLKDVAEIVPCWCENELMHYEYDEKANCFRFEGHGKYSNYTIALNNMWCIYQHQQAKVEGLQKQNDWLSDVAERENKRANKLKEKNVSTTVLLGKVEQQKAELQKRVDDSIFILSTIDNPDEAYKLIDLLLRTLKGSTKELEQALKGDMQ